MADRKKYETILWQILLVLLTFTMLSFWMLGNLYARYVTEADGEDGARVAAYVFQLEDGSSSQILNLEQVKKPGDTQEYTFSVTNKKKNMISEVAQSYTIQLEVEGSMPLICEIVEQSEAETEAGTSVCKAEHTKNVVNSSSSSVIRIPAAEEYTKAYKMTVTWPETYNDETYASASGTSVVTLTVDAQQLQ